MDSIIFEDPSKPRLRQKPQVRAALVSSSTSLGRACTPEVEPRVVKPVPGIQLQEHSHTSNLGHSEPSTLRDQTSEIPLDELCRSPLHNDSPGDGWTLEGTSFHEDFSIAQIDDDGLAERLDNDDDLASLFSGVLPDLECFTTTESDQHSDAQAQTYASRVAGTSDFVNSSPSDDLVCFETPGLRANSNAIDLAAESNCPEPKLTAARSPQRCSPPSSRHKPGIEVVISTRRPSPITQRNLSGTQAADDLVKPNAARRRTASPRLSGPVKHISGHKRRYMSESNLDSLDSRRVRVEADPKNTPTLVPHMLNGTANSRGRETHLHEPGCKVRAGIHNPVYGSDSEQTLIDHGASINCDDQTGRDMLLRELCPTPTSPPDIDEPFNEHGQEQHKDRLKGLSIQPVTSGDAGFVTAIIDSPADLQDIFHSPTDWALGRGVQSNDLANIVLKPLAEHCWLLTATILRRATKMDNQRRDRARRRGRDSPDLDTSSDFCPSESETISRPTKRGHWTLDEDNNLTRWRILGKSWSWIFNQFPERSEAAVRSRWFVVLAPRARPT
ncbi:hypothetical protein PV08_08985 [Exophiala spinifera]|uniref:Uncharacterized protein n=1 Tax=Exophiala spinifera TaxID=91928 RepID=A0A0D2B4A3_9EURO|nr:uncharacterized protein PV08_08985 [Exophiala spinifera]KIW13793.1 hypothetical protein PV08_08985 [Exophiala spinifera]